MTSYMLALLLLLLLLLLLELMLLWAINSYQQTFHISIFPGPPQSNHEYDVLARDARCATITRRNSVHCVFLPQECWY